MKSVSDEWDRDMLHVTFDAARVTVEQMCELIAKEGLEANLREQPK